MALVTLMSLLDDTILVQLDVSAAGAVVGVAASNGSNRTATVTLTRLAENQWAHLSGKL